MTAVVTGEVTALHDAVCLVVGFIFAVPKSALLREERGAPHLCRARKVAMYLLHIRGVDFTLVGTLFKRERTNVMHAVQSVEDKRDDKRFDQMLTEAEQAVMGAVAAAWLYKLKDYSDDPVP